MRRIEKEIIIDRRAEIVFDYLADMSGLREWAPEDFVEVRALDEAPIGLRKRFEYETTGAHARSWFGWDVFEPPRHLAFSGPRVNVGPGWVEGRGDYILEPLDGRTRLRAAIMPRFGGLIKLLEPLATRQNARKLEHQLQRLKAKLESR